MNSIKIRGFVLRLKRRAENTAIYIQRILTYCLDVNYTKGIQCIQMRMRCIGVVLYFQKLYQTLNFKHRLLRYGIVMNIIDSWCRLVIMNLNVLVEVFRTNPN